MAYVGTQGSNNIWQYENAATSKYIFWLQGANSTISWVRTYTKPRWYGKKLY